MRKMKKWTALFCAGFMAVSFLAGCGSKSESDDTAAVPKQENKNTAAAEEENEEKSMGRYLEREMVLPEEISEMVQYPLPYIKKLESGDLMLAEKETGKYISSDGGETWESAGNPWKDVGKNLYMTNMAVSPNGAVALPGIFTGDGESESSEAEETSQDDASETENGGAENADAEREEIRWKYYYFDAEGNETELDLADTEIRSFVFDGSERLYGLAGGGKVYRIDPADGSKKELFSADGTVDFACFTDKYMVGITTRGGAVVYDIEQDILMDTDEVLQEFIGQNLGLSIGSTDMGHSVVMTAGEQDDVIYFAFDGGLYRHVIGGAAIEQIIDGASSSFGDPSLMLMSMETLPDNEFMVLYTGMKLYRYTYDPNVPTVPDKQLKIYSLMESVAVRQAVSMFQKAHQDVYIRYEIGMSGDDGVTREDAVRNLNTKIMSGEGPDILMLGGLPRASYEEKGILADLSGITEEMSGDAALFPNIIEACRKDGKIYALPVRIQLLLMAGEPEDVGKVKDMDSLAKLTEELREEEPEGALLAVRTPEQLLYILSLSCSAAWTDEEGNIDEKALEEFLTAAKRIWEAEISGVTEEELGVREGGYGSLTNEYRQYYGNTSGSAENIMMEMQKFAVGRVRGVDFEYDMLTTIAEQEDQFAFDVWNGQVSNGFLSDCLVGISANSVENETAVEFYRYLFGKEFQDIDVYDGLPVNMASFEGLKENPRAGMVEGASERAAGSIGTSTPDGKEFGIELLWPTEEEFERLRGMISSVSRISTGDDTIAETVYEIGPRALEGSITPKEAVQEIVKKSAIYLAE